MRLPLALLFALLTSVAFAAPPMSQLLPDTTKGCLLCPDVQLMQEKWDQTEFGRWLNDPLMKPYLDDLRAQVRNEADADSIQYGVTWDDVKDIARGEATIALVHTPPKRPVRVVLVDVTGNVPAATAVLTKVFKSLSDPRKAVHQRAASWRQDLVRKEKLTVFQLPKHAKDPQRSPQMAYFIMQNILGAVEDEGVAKTIMERIAGQGGDTLEKIAGYQTVMKRCQADAEKTSAGAPHLRWYVNPVPYSEARRQIDPQFLKDGKMDLLRAVKNSGFTGVEAMGGFAHLAAAPFDVLNRAAVYAPPPTNKTLGGFKTPNMAPVAPPAWIGAQAASYMGGSLDLPTLLQNIGPLYDFSIGDGDGAWKDTLKGIREDKHGPKVDLEQRLFEKMGVRLLRVTDVTDPIQIHSERRLMIAELADGKEALAALEAFYANDPTAEKTTEDGQTYWKIWPEKRKPDDIPSGVAVMHGHLFFATQAAMLKSYFQDLKAPEQLASDKDFLSVREHIQAESKKRGWDKLFVQRFVRSREAYRPTYELLRANQLPNSDTLLSSVLNMAIGQEPGGKARPQRTNGKLLPEYAQMRQYFLPSGSFGVWEEGPDFQGWFLLGFALSKANPGVANRPAE